jgi:D-beta-D-heptose 7-phosphate kinase/D-beta-D-heptose 1-phosphate adenosyltransferase
MHSTPNPAGFHPTSGNPKVVDWPTLLERRAGHRAAHQTVVWTNGCFDMLHAGHVLSLQAARRLGDVLVVGVNSDVSVARLKGPGRPIIAASQRALLLAALECVDYVIIFDELTPESALARLEPDVHCKGADYAPPHGKPIPEAAVVAAYGGRVEFLPLVPALSTSDLLRRAREGEGSAESAWTPLLAAFAAQRILIIGDVMLDEYLWGEVRRISAEAPVPIVEVSRRTWSPGGAANTALNVVALGGQSVLGGVIGADTAADRLRDRLHQGGVAAGGLVVDPERITTTKTRVMALHHQVVRVDEEERQWLSAKYEDVLLGWAANEMPHVQACILSDYAKGVVSPRLAARFIELARQAGKPVVVDPKGTDYAKYRGATIVKPNLHEARRFADQAGASEASLDEIAKRLLDQIQGSAVLLTRGAEGMSLFSPGCPAVHIPSVARDVFDVTGAGDTVAATLALALAAGAPLTEAAHLANRAGGLVVGKMGTATVTREEISKSQ